MIDKRDFIEREIAPVLGSYIGDYDIDGIVDDVYAWDDRIGYIIKPDLSFGEFWEIVERHDKSHVACPSCSAVNLIGRAKQVSADSQLVVLEMSCRECGTVWRRSYRFEQEEF